MQIKQKLMILIHFGKTRVGPVFTSRFLPAGKNRLKPRQKPKGFLPLTGKNWQKRNFATKIGPNAEKMFLFDFITSSVST